MTEPSHTSKATAGMRRAVPLFLAVGAIFLTVCFITGNTGLIGRWISRVLLGLFSAAAYGIPVLMAVHAVFYLSDCKQNRRLSRLIFSSLTLISVSSVLYAIEYFGKELTFSPAEFYELGTRCRGGGFVGSSVAYGVIQIIGVWGFFLLSLLVITLYLTYYFPRFSRRYGSVFPLL